MILLDEAVLFSVFKPFLLFILPILIKFQFFFLFKEKFKLGCEVVIPNLNPFKVKYLATKSSNIPPNPIPW